MELFVSFSEIMQYFKRNLTKLLVVMALFGIVFGLAPLKLYHHEYSTSTTMVFSCQIPEDAGTEYRLQYTGILANRVQAAVAMTQGSDIAQQTAKKLGIDPALISNIAAAQLNASPVVKISVSSPNAGLVAKIADTAAEVLAEKTKSSFPSPALTAMITDKAVAQNPQSSKAIMVKTGLIGLVVGFLLFVCFGIIVVLTDKTIRNTRYVSEALKTHLLGEAYKHANDQKKLDSYRKIRAAAVHQAGEGKTFMVTDVCQNNGAECVSEGLGIAMARAEKTVLLIDADVRTNKIAKSLNITPEKNLSDILEGQCAVQQAITETSISGLSFIAGSEKSAENFSDVLASGKFRKLLDELVPKYDYVVVNVPSEVNYPDADNLASLFQSVIMAAKYGSTPYSEFKDSFYRLKTAGANIIGFVTTNC